MQPKNSKYEKIILNNILHTYCHLVTKFFSKFYFSFHWISLCNSYIKNCPHKYSFDFYIWLTWICFSLWFIEKIVIPFYACVMQIFWHLRVCSPGLCFPCIKKNSVYSKNFRVLLTIHGKNFHVFENTRKFFERTEFFLIHGNFFRVFPNTRNFFSSVYFQIHGKNFFSVYS